MSATEKPRLYVVRNNYDSDLPPLFPSYEHILLGAQDIMDKHPNFQSRFCISKAVKESLSERPTNWTVAHYRENLLRMFDLDTLYTYFPTEWIDFEGLVLETLQVAGEPTLKKIMGNISAEDQQMSLRYLEGFSYILPVTAIAASMGHHFANVIKEDSNQIHRRDPLVIAADSLFHKPLLSSSAEIDSGKHVDALIAKLGQVLTKNSSGTLPLISALQQSTFLGQANLQEVIPGVTNFLTYTFAEFGACLKSPNYRSDFIKRISSSTSLFDL